MSPSDETAVGGVISRSRLVASSRCSSTVCSTDASVPMMSLFWANASALCDLRVGEAMEIVGLARHAGTQQRVAVLGRDPALGTHPRRLRGHRHGARVPAAALGKVGDARGVDLAERRVFQQRVDRLVQPRELGRPRHVGGVHDRVELDLRRCLVHDRRAREERVLARRVEDAHLEVGAQLAAQ